MLLFLYNIVFLMRLEYDLLFWEYVFFDFFDIFDLIF